MSDFDAKLIQEFISEGKEHLEVTEKALLQLENSYQNPDTELINQVFRAVHSLKGAAGFFGFKNLGMLSHRMETLLQKIRDNVLSFHPQMFEPLFEGVDLLSQMLDDIEGSENYEIVILTEILEKLAKGEVNLFPSKQIISQKDKQVPLTKEWIEKMIEKGGNNLFLIHLRLPEIIKDISELESFMSNLETLGSILDVSENYNQMRETNIIEPITIVYDTIMELDLVSIALDIAEQDVQLFDLTLIESDIPDSEPITPPISKVSPGKELSKVAEPIAPKPKKKNIKIPHDETIRVSLSHLNKLMNLAGELVLSRNQLLQIIGNKDIPVLNVLSQRITEMQENIMATRMQPIDNLFNKFNRIVRDLSKNVQKKIKLTIMAKDVEVDNTIIEAMGDPLTHLIRNSIDHGVEKPQDRLNTNKPEMGNIHLLAAHKGGHVIITVRDDGKGIDYRSIRDSALKKELITEDDASRMSQKDIIALVFKPGFSTAEKVTSISGRGVGMDVVKTNLEKIGGTIEVNTKINVGTEFIITIPLTLAIIPTLIIESSQQRFAIPQININELVRLKPHEIATRIEVLGDSKVLRLREKLLPLINLREILQLPKMFIHPKTGELKIDNRQPLYDRRAHNIAINEPVQQEEIDEKRENKERRRSVYSAANIVVVNMGNNDFGIIIDKILDTEEIVVKPLSQLLHKVSLFSGATIQGDGRVILILDIANIAHEAKLAFKETEKLANLELELKQAKDIIERQDFFLFNINSYEQFSIPLSLIERIETFRESHIQIIGHKEYINYLGESLRIIRLENILKVSSSEPQNDDLLYLIIPQIGKVKIGIVFNNIIDVINIHVEIDKNTIHEEGIMGTSIIKDRITIFLDVYKISEIAEPEKFEYIRTKELAERSQKIITILLAEDTPFFRNLISGYLTSAGYHVISVKDGQEGYEYLVEHYEKIDLVISDIQMPRMDGLELVQKIKENPTLNHFNVLALTSLDSPENIQHGHDAGFDDYLIKVDKETLLETISKYL